jgi:hypothetical protein
MKPLKEYYFFNPHDFSPNDADLMDKSLRYAERMQAKVAKFKENNERDKNLERIFKEVKQQQKSIMMAKKVGNTDPNAETSPVNDGRKKKKKSKRNKQKHLKKIELGDQIIMIDSTTAE